MAAELRLGVSFDLVYFRQQLQKLGRIASSEFAAPIKIKLDRRVIDKELNDLQRLIKRRKYNIELNIAGGLRKQTFDDLQARLDALSTRKKVEIPVSVKNSATGKDVNDTVIGIKARIAQNQTVKQGDGKIRIGTSIKPSITNADVADFRRVVQAKLSGISVKVKADIQGGFASGPTGLAGLQEYMRTQGLSGGNVPGAAQTGRRTQFEAAVAQASNRELQDMMRRAKVQGRSSIRSSAAMRKSLMQLDDAAMESVLGNLQMNMNDPRRVKRGFLDQVARAVFWMAGVDPEYLKRQAAQRRALPGVDFPATVPPSNVSIGPSGTGRALPAGAIPGALPGTAFGARGFLPPQLGQDLQNILRNAAFTFVDSLNARIRQVNVREIGRQALPPSMIRGLLPSAVGRTPATYGGPADRGSFVQNRIAQAYARSALRGASVMAESPQGFALGAGGSGTAGPYRPFDRPQRGGALAQYQQPSVTRLSSELPPNYFQTGRLAAGIRGLGADFNQAKLPLAGAVRELGDEFATATKQVLLYGTAYKALAFLTNLPAQAFEAAKALQTINNQLEAVTGSASNADRSFAFIDDLASRFNVPLASARDGFVKLYASMEPAGFSGSEIEGLFEGISKATATFGLSADQVDRVNYAFAQMASKGQIMSEELKGQLGDVLPGSLALFARAAQMSIPEFSKAMEDGAFKSDAMAQVLRNVAKIMNSDFGGAAANAANTLQGALNGMQNSVQRLYEAFEPVVDAIASQAFPLISEAVANATQAIKAFGAVISGNEGPANMLEGDARAIYDAMRSLQEIFTAVGRVIQGLAPTFSLLGRVLLTIADAISRVVNTKFGGFFADLAIKVGIGMIAVQAFSRVMGFQLVASLVTAAQSARTFTGSIRAMIVALRTSETAARAFRLAMTGLVVGGILIGLEKLVEHIGRVANRLRDARKAALEAKDAILSMSTTQLIQEKRTREQNIRMLEGLAARGTKKNVTVNKAQADALREMGLPVSTIPGLQGEETTYQVPGYLIPAQIQAQKDLLAQADYTFRNRDFTPSTPDLEKIDLAPGKDKGTRDRQLRDFENEAIAQLKLNQRLAQERLDQRRQLELMDETEYAIASAANKRKFELLIIEESLAQKRADIGKFEAGVRTKQLAVFEQLAANERTLVEEEYKTAVQGAKLKLAKPFKEAIRDENIEIEKQARLLENLRNGYLELTPEQEAAYVIEEKTKELKASQQRIIQTEIDNLKKLTLQRILATNAAQRELDLLKLRNQAAQLRAPLGKERLVELAQTPGYTQEQAQAQFALEEQNRRLQVMKEGAASLAGTINSSVGDALVNLATDFQNAQQHGLNFLQAIADGFKQLANTIIQEMTRAMINQAVSKLFNFLMPAVGLFSGNAGITGGGFGSFSGGSLGVDSGGVLGQVGANLTARPFANGGVVTGPTLGLVGEGRFNEAVVPLPDGRKIPVELGGGAGNNISTNIVVNVNNGQASSQINGSGGQSLGREIEGAVRSVILKETRPGGIIYGSR